MKLANPSRSNGPRSATDGRILSYAGLLAGLAALAGASCCVLPLAFAAIGAGGAWIALLGVTVTYRPYLIGIAIAVIVLAWSIALRQGARRGTHATLVLASAAVVASLAVTAHEVEITRYLAQLWMKS